MGITGKRMKDVVRRPPARFFNYEIGADLGFSSQLAGSELERPIVSLQLYSVREGDSSPALPSRSAAWTRARPTSFGREHNEDVTSICRLIMVGLCAFAASPQPLPVGQLRRGMEACALAARTTIGDPGMRFCRCREVSVGRTFGGLTLIATLVQTS